MKGKYLCLCCAEQIVLHINEQCRSNNPDCISYIPPKQENSNMNFKKGMKGKTSDGKDYEVVAVVKNASWPVAAIITYSDGSQLVASFSVDGIGSTRNLKLPPVKAYTFVFTKDGRMFGETYETTELYQKRLDYYKSHGYRLVKEYVTELEVGC